MKPVKTKERRKIPRIPMGVSILIPHLQKKVICHDLSKEGCFFKALDLGLVGNAFSVIIDLPEIGMIPVDVRIIHKGEEGQDSGLKFTAIDPGDAEKLDFFLEIFQGGF
jgi:PilZ domain